MGSKIDIAGNYREDTVRNDENKNQNSDVVDKFFLLFFSIDQHYIEKAWQDDGHHSLTNCS